MAQTFFAGVTGLAILFNEEITNIKKKISDDIYYTFYRDIKINKEQSPKTVFAIKEHLSYKSLTFQEIEIIPSFSTEFRYTGSDGYNELNYEIANGTYKIPNDIWHKITNFDKYISNYFSFFFRI